MTMEVIASACCPKGRPRMTGLVSVLALAAFLTGCAASGVTSSNPGQSTVDSGPASGTATSAAVSGSGLLADAAVVWCGSHLREFSSAAFQLGIYTAYQDTGPTIDITGIDGTRGPSDLPSMLAIVADGTADLSDGQQAAVVFEVFEAWRAVDLPNYQRSCQAAFDAR